MEKTAVEYLIEQLNDYDSKMIELFEKEISQAKKNEKQQIIDAFEGFPLNTRNSQNGQEYYNETFKK